MSAIKRTLHLFGGGPLVKLSEKIAYNNNWNVVLRTGKRFIKSLPEMDQKTKILVGDNLMDLIMESDEPKLGDIGLSISAPWIFKKIHIDKFYGLLYNIHNQPLPKFKGAGGSSWRIMMNDYNGGSCIHYLSEGIDDGEIVDKVDFKFSPKCICPKDFDDITLIHSKDLIKRWLTKIISDPLAITKKIKKYKSINSEYWPRINSEVHGWINWNWNIHEISQFCKAFSYPHRGAQTTIRQTKIFIKQVSYELNSNKFHSFQNGLIFNISDKIIYVAHKDGTLYIEDYEFEDKNVKLRLGDRFFTDSEKLEKAMNTRIQYHPNGTIYKN